EVQVRRSKDPALPSPIEKGSTLREVVWGVESAEDLERLRGALGDAARAADMLRAADPNGLGVAFRVTRKRTVAAEGVRANTWDRRERVDQPARIYERAEPIEVGHVVFFVADLVATEAFYTSLGFVPSDRYPGRGTFMRCAPRGGHHDLFLLRSPEG